VLEMRQGQAQEEAEEKPTPRTQRHKNKLSGTLDSPI
jgi:hypothetical protein